MFKKTLLALSFATLSASAFSAPVVNIIVNGKVTPPTCEVNAEQETTLTYTFDVAPGLFPASGNLTLPSQTHPINISCDATTYLSFTATDSQANTELNTSATNYGLGKFEDGTLIGQYTMRIKNTTVQADADATATATGVRVTSTYSAGTTGALVPEASVVSWANSATTLAGGQVFNADIEVTPTLNSALKNVAGEPELDGHAILAFSFGV